MHIQVKTFVPGNSTCSMGMKAEKDFGENFFWVLGRIPNPNLSKNFEYYVIPALIMAKNILEGNQRWLKSPGVRGPAHKDNTVRTVDLPPYKSLSSWDVSEFLR